MLQILGMAGTVIGVLALAAAAWSFVALARSGRLDRDYLRRRGVLDGWLFGMWGCLLAGSAGLLLEAPWAPAVLRLWCGLLGAWTLWYTFANLYSLRGLAPEVPVRWTSVIVGAAVAWTVVATVVAAVLVVLHRAGM
jgi:hypothetical protein